MDVDGPAQEQTQLPSQLPNQWPRCSRPPATLRRFTSSPEKNVETTAFAVQAPGEICALCVRTGATVTTRWASIRRRTTPLALLTGGILQMPSGPAAGPEDAHALIGRPVLMR